MASQYLQNSVFNFGFTNHLCWSKSDWWKKSNNLKWWLLYVEFDFLPYVVFCSMFEPSLCNWRHLTCIRVIKVLFRSEPEPPYFKALYFGWLSLIEKLAISKGYVAEIYDFCTIKNSPKAASYLSRRLIIFYIDRLNIHFFIWNKFGFIFPFIT